MEDLPMIHDNHHPQKTTTGKRLWKPIAILSAVIAMLVLASYLGIGEWLTNLKGFIDRLGFWGPFVFLAIYIAATVAAIPGSALTLIAGVIFGSVLGTILVSIASTAGAALCFMISRYFARDAVAEWLASNERFRTLDQMTERSGALIVALTRLVPLFPFNLLNYGFGLTKVKFSTYVFWSWLCMLPATISYVVGAAAASRGVAEGKIPWELLGILLVAVPILGVIVQAARKRLKAEEEKTRMSA